jgi:hypothetical protein
MELSKCEIRFRRCRVRGIGVPPELCAQGKESLRDPRALRPTLVSALYRGTSLEVAVSVMRRRFRVLALAAIIAAVVVPLGFALSREADAVAVTPHVQGAAVVASTIAVSPKAIGRDRSASMLRLPSVPAGAKLLFVGTALFGVAAAVRRVV